ncbi:hypothetical protein [Tabrizicola flagellatus]|uniref:hypothetical protein n=1 Tax=Tabrizicola flagellatus TaxID=2593021 RepID=UPI00135813DB|nr:hypothetical protein [Tabrizicola flagellatus]
MSAPHVALCAIVRNEIRSRIEWLAHWKVLGVSEVVICDDASTDGTTVVLARAPG